MFQRWEDNTSIIPRDQHVVFHIKLKRRIMLYVILISLFLSYSDERIQLLYLYSYQFLRNTFY